MIRAYRFAALSACLIALAGCGALPTTHYYLLEPQDAAAPLVVSAPASAGLSIGIAPFQVDAPYDQDRVVYRLGEHSTEVGYYAYHRWASPLSRMLPQVVAGVFGNTAEIASIEPASPDRDYDATLRGRVTALEEIDGRDGPSVRIGLTLSLVTADGAVLWREYLTSRDSAGPADDVSQIVERIRATLDALLARFRDSLAQTLRGSATP